MAHHVVGLSVIIPCFNEAATLPRLLSSLASQRGAPAFEVIVVDGGSLDDTLVLATEAAQRHGLAIVGIAAASGRGHQMNVGAEAAKGRDLLFLHADTVLPHRGVLARAQQAMSQARARYGNDNVAGHFGLRFMRSRIQYDGAYHYYEAKTHLNRPECINGDQGLWLSPRFFSALGCFDESLPYMEDTRLAAAIARQGIWFNLPDVVTTAARRFEVEGLKERQILNALLRSFDAIGLDNYFSAAQQAYVCQQQAARLKLRPFFKLAHALVWGEGLSVALRRWYSTGAYVASQAWQLAFALDCARNRRLGLMPGEGPRTYLQWFDKRIAPFTNSMVGHLLTAMVVGIWFYAMLLNPFED